jgi:hypothetical protein
MQYILIELYPQETLLRGGTFMFIDDGIQMETIFGDSFNQSTQCYHL